MFTPWADFDRAFPEFDIFRRHAAEAPSAARPESEVRAVWEDQADHYTILLEVPGFEESALKVDTLRDMVTVSGERKPTTPEGHRALRRERGNVSFSRTFGLPANADGANMTATLKDGVLALHVPKHAQASARSIPVTVAHA